MKYDVIYEYVKKYFKDNFIEAYLIFDGRIDYIEKKYIELYDKEIKDKYNIDDVRSNKNLDEVNLKVYNILNKFILEYFSERQIDDCNKLYNYIKDLLVENNINNNFSDDIFEHIIRLVMARVWAQYDSSRLGEENFNHVINLVYNNTCNQYARMIGKKIDSILDYEYDFFKFRDMNIDKNELKRNVIGYVFINEDRDFLLRIRNMVIIEGQGLSGIALELNKYINKYFNLSKKNDLVSDKQEDVSNVLVDNKNSDAKINRDMIKNNSVKRDGVPSRSKLNKKQKKVAKAVIMLAILGALVGVGVSINNSHEYTDSEYAVMRVNGLDNFDYTSKWRINSVDEIADNIISVYSKLGQLPNENYKTLGLYNAYDGIMSIKNNDDALLGMETLFSLLRGKMVQEDINENLRTVIKAGIEDNYFYLDFVYDTLINAGYEEYSSKKYQDVLLRYKYANFGNHFGVVGVTLKEYEKEMIRDIMIEYQEYYKNVEEKIGDLMVSGDYSFFATYTGKGK